MTTKQKTRLTPRFYTVTGILVACLGGGILFGNLAAIQVACFCGALLAWCYVLSRRNIQTIQVTRRFSSRAFAREPFSVGLSFEPSSSNRETVCLEYSDQLIGNGAYYSGPLAHNAIQARTPRTALIPSINAIASTSVKQMCTVRQRGVYTAFDCQAVSRYPFGLFEQPIPVECGQGELTVYPFPEQPPILEQLFAVGIGTGNDNIHRRRDTAGEFKGLRDYASGDPVKLIHWPLSARYQNLVVKDFEPVAPEEVIIIFHSFWDDKKTPMQPPEYALQILAGMFIMLHNNGTEFSFFPSFGKWEEIRVDDDPETLEGALESLARADISPVIDLAPLIELLDDLPDDDRRVIVFSNSPKKHWQDQLGSDNALICLDCRMELDLEHLSAGSRRRRLEGVAS